MATLKDSKPKRAPGSGYTPGTKKTAGKAAADEKARQDEDRQFAAAIVWMIKTKAAILAFQRRPPLQRASPGTLLGGRRGDLVCAIGAELATATLRAHLVIPLCHAGGHYGREQLPKRSWLVP